MKTQCLLCEGSIPGTIGPISPVPKRTVYKGGKLREGSGMKINREAAPWKRSSLRCYYMYLSRRLGSCWQGIHKGPLATGEEAALETPMGFMNL